MSIEESIQQIKTLIEAWQLDEADLNQTDINAMQTLLKENKELKQKYLNAVADYETTMAEKEQLRKQLKDKTEDYRRMKDNFDSKVAVLTKIETQQKEFIEYLENEIYSYELIKDCLFSNNKKLKILKDILSKYKEIIGDINDKK